MRLIIAGSRTCTNERFIHSRLDRLPIDKIECVISGMCQGADLIGWLWAKRRGIPIMEFRANWSLGKKAGPIRNKEMAKVGTHLILFTSDIELSVGSKNMLDTAIKERMTIINIFQEPKGELIDFSEARKVSF